MGGSIGQIITNSGNSSEMHSVRYNNYETGASILAVSSSLDTAQSLATNALSVSGGKSTTSVVSGSSLSFMGINPFYVQYNRENAVAYVLQWYNSHNPDYLAMDDLLTSILYFSGYRAILGMADCTNFTSQALFSGGVSMNDSWHYYEYQNKYSFWWSFLNSFGTMQNMYVTRDGKVTSSPKEYDFTGSWALANQQFLYFSNPDNGYISGEIINISPNSRDDIANAIGSGAQIGDLLYWSWDSNGFANHSTMITEISDGEIKYGGHTRSADRVDLFDRLSEYQNATVQIVRIQNYVQ